MKKTFTQGLALLLAFVMCVCLLPATFIAADEATTANSADFDAIVLPSSKPKGDSSYSNSYTSPNGWVTTNSAIQCGGPSDMNPQYTVIGADTSSKAVCMNGKVSAPGKITSPTLTGGISKLTIIYTKIFSDTKLGATITITDVATGTTYTNTLSKEAPSTEKFTKWTFEWTLETPISGDFTIEVLNNSPSANTGNKDRLTILDLFWEAPAAVQEITSSYTMSDYKISTELGGSTATRDLDDTLTFTISSGWFNNEARIYKNANGVLASKHPISSLAINAGYKDSTFDVYTSEDGETWTMFQEDVAYVSSYCDVTLTFATPVKYVKLDAPNQQIRIKSITATVLASGSTETPSEPSETPSEPSETPSEPSEPSEPSVTPSEPSVTPSEPSVTPSEPSVTPSEPAAPSTGLVVIDKPVAGTAYKFGMVQPNVSSTNVYYLKGGMDGYYMATTTDKAEAIDVYLEETTGGYYLYTMDGANKLYINMVVSGTHVNGAYEATASTVYRYDETAKTLIAVVNDTDYWFGTRNDREYTTVGPCATSYNGFYCQFYGEPAGSSNTGDNSIVSVAVAVLVLSAIGGTALVLKKKEN